MMDINTKLREDPFLFPKEVDNKKRNASGIIVTALNKKGIESIKDLITYDQTKFNRFHAHYFNALIQILRYKYLNEELVNDILLESKYTHSLKDINRLANNLRRLGFGRSLQELEERVQRFMEDAPSKFTMEDVLKSNNRFIRTMNLLGNADFKGFYLEYIEKKRQKEKEEENYLSKDILKDLKLQLEKKKKKRNDIDKEIQKMECKMSRLKERKFYGI